MILFRVIGLSTLLATNSSIVGVLMKLDSSREEFLGGLVVEHDVRGRFVA